MPLLTIKREHAHAVWHEIQPLLTEHWREIAHYEDIPLKPRREIYMALDATGKLRIYTMRDGPTLVGYAVFIVDHDLHYGASLTARQDVLFLLPDYRDAGNGATLIGYCDGALKREGVQVVCHHVKLAHDFGRLLGALGYEPVETLYSKRLDLENVG